MSYCVYCHTNKENGKKYIGMTGTENVKRRWHAGAGYIYNADFYADIKENGWDGFEHEILYSGLDREEAEKLETEMIIKFETTNPMKGYNISIGKTSLGCHHTQETRDRISKKLKVRAFTPEHRKHISEQKSGVKHHMAKKVYQYEKDGRFVREWDYMNEAAKTLGIAKESISAVCLGKRSSAGGYIWRYEKE